MWEESSAREFFCPLPLIFPFRKVGFNEGRRKFNSIFWLVLRGEKSARVVLQTALVCCHPTPGNRNSGKEPGERDSQAETKSCGASTIPAEGERSDLWNGASPEGCVTSAEISQSHKNPLNQRMPLNKETFLSSLSVRNQTKFIARSTGVIATCWLSQFHLWECLSYPLFFFS